MDNNDVKTLNPSDIQGIESNQIIYNPSYELLKKHELSSDSEGYECGQLTNKSAVNVRTGVFTGRSPKDKYIVYDDQSEQNVWWKKMGKSSDNKPITIETWNEFKKIAVNHLNGKRLYVVDVFCGATEENRLSIRFVVEVAWQAHFVKNMFILPSEEELKNFTPDFNAIIASKVVNPNWEKMTQANGKKIKSENFVAFNLTERSMVVGGTWYGGEMKKGIFSVMNYFLPLKGMASMHCSANVGEKGDVALFFGLSGTGKTTLSTDPKRALIGDDEHGWDDEGVFNFEGGCYAKTINLSKENEPDIYNAIRDNALLENVVVDESGEIDFDDGSITQNTRVSYPIDYINNIVKPVSKAGHAKKIIFLTADAYGVLPPVAKLNKGQTQYHFLSGFTAKLAGTECGIDEPVPTFSACFGGAFLTLHPTVYGRELVRKMEEHNATAYLVNTGWNGTKKRISIKDTRAIIDAILSGEVDKAETTVLDIFNLEIPTHIEGVDSAILDPRNTYKKTGKWYKRANKLSRHFRKNFERYADNEEGKTLKNFGPDKVELEEE